MPVLLGLGLVLVFWALLAGLRNNVRAPKLLWSTQYCPAPAHFAGHDITARQLLDGDTFVQCDSAGLGAYTLRGSRLWVCNPRPGHGHFLRFAVNAAGLIYACTNQGYLYAQDHNGTALWQANPFPDRTGHRAAVACLGSDVLVVSTHMAARLNDTGEVVWKRDIAGLTGYSLLVVSADNTAYLCTHDKHLLALAPDGSVLWRSTATLGESLGTSAPLLADDGRILCDQRQRGKLTSLNPDGTTGWQFNYDPADATDDYPLLAAGGRAVIARRIGDRQELAAIGPAGEIAWVFPCGNAVDARGIQTADGKLWVVTDNASSPPVASAMLPELDKFIVPLRASIVEHPGAVLTRLDSDGAVLRQGKLGRLLTYCPLLTAGTTVLILDETGKLSCYGN